MYIPDDLFIYIEQCNNEPLQCHIDTPIGNKHFVGYENLDLWSALREYGIGGRLLGSVEALYKESKACVRVEGELSEEFSVQRAKAGVPIITMHMVI